MFQDRTAKGACAVRLAPRINTTACVYAASAQKRSSVSKIIIAPWIPTPRLFHTQLEARSEGALEDFSRPHAKISVHGALLPVDRRYCLRMSKNRSKTDCRSPAGLTTSWFILLHTASPRTRWSARDDLVDGTRATLAQRPPDESARTVPRPSRPSLTFRTSRPSRPSRPSR